MIRLTAVAISLGLLAAPAFAGDGNLEADAKTEKPASLSFAKLDTNADGALDAVELKVAPDLAKQLKGADADGNGTIDRTEFSTLWRNSKPDSQE